MNKHRPQDSRRTLAKLIWRGFNYAELKCKKGLEAADYIAGYLLTEGVIVLPCPAKPDIQVKMEEDYSVRKTTTYRWHEKTMCFDADEQGRIYDEWQIEKEENDAAPLQEFADRKLI